MKKNFKDLKLKVKIRLKVFNTWTCWHWGVRELERVYQGRFKRFQFRAGDRIRNSVPAKKWCSAEFVNLSAGCTTLSGSLPLFFLKLKGIFKASIDYQLGSHQLGPQL